MITRGVNLLPARNRAILLVLCLTLTLFLSAQLASGADGAYVGLISDQTELTAITPILDDMDVAFEVLNGNWDGAEGIYTSDLSLLSNYDVVIWYASGATFGRLTTMAEHDALEQYVQAGGRLLVTGYDTIGSPTDALLADLIRSTSSGDGPFTYDYTVTDGSHPIMDGPFGSYPTGTPLTAAHNDHDQAEADTARNAVTVAELSGGRDKIIATDLNPAAPESGRIVYWNGNRNVLDWVGRAAVAPLGDDGEEKETGAEDGMPIDVPLTNEEMLDHAFPVDADAVPPAANVEDSDRGLQLDPAFVEELKDLRAGQAPLASDTTTFIATGDTVIVTNDPYWWHAGDYAEGTRTLSVDSVEHLDYSMVIGANYLSGSGHVDLQLSINGHVVGAFTVLPGQMVKNLSFDFPAISGPTYTIRLEETNTVDPGLGSITLPLDVSMMVLSSSQPEIFKNTIAWLSADASIVPPRSLAFFDDMESGVNGWTATGLWHQVQDGVSPYPNSFSPTHSWWYGQDATGDYDTGAPNRGNLTSPPIELPPGAQAELSFWHWYETEPFYQPQSIYFDVYHDADGNDNTTTGIYSQWASELGIYGWTVTEYNQPINLPNLNNHDVLALFDPEVALSGAEITAINSFMQGGGRVVALGEYNDLQGVNTVLNALTAGHGITLNNDSVTDSTDNDGQPYWPVIHSFAEASPFTRNVGSVVLYAGASLTLGGAAEPLATGDGDTTAALPVQEGAADADEAGTGSELAVPPLAIVPGAPVVMAHAPVGAGDLLAIGDSGLWANDDPDGDTIPAVFEYNNMVLAYRFFGNEVDSPYWDSKWLQISVDNGSFQDLVQLTGESMDTWHHATVDLSAYDDSVIRLRFRFDTIDSVLNAYRGWYIDDVLVMPVAPEAAFSGTPLVGIAPLNVAFTNVSSGVYDTCNWQFGDGTGSTDCNDPSHNYTSGGAYTVSLQVTGPGGSDTETKVNYITVYDPVSANFSGAPTSGVAPLNVAFTNLSSGDYTTCVWQFGDGTGSNSCANPNHSYTGGGDYTVSLQVTGPGGVDTETKVHYITVYDPVNANFSGTPTSGVAPLNVAFTNLSSGDYTTCVWQFGDGTSSNSCGNPSHAYGSGGVYTVSLALSGPGGADTETKVDYVTVYEPVAAGFEGTPTSGGVPLNVAFTNLSTGDFTSCDWDFGDGQSSTDCGDPNHTYAGVGVYTVSLEVSGPGGTDTETRVDYITVTPVNADFSAAPTSGVAPLNVDFTNLSSGVFTACAWDFGDGSSSNVCGDPSHTYTGGGVYTVSLQVTGPGGSDTETKVAYITVHDPVSAGFAGDPTSGTMPLTVQFTNLSTGDFDTCTWEFGDGASSNVCSDPSHTYANSGAYTVSLEVSGPGGTDTETKSGYIVVEPRKVYLPMIAK